MTVHANSESASSVGHGIAWPAGASVESSDAFVVDDRVGLYVVADGSDSEHGAAAASLAVRIVGAEIERRTDTEALRELLRASVASAARAVNEFCAGLPSGHGAGTTVSALLVRDGRAALAHVGDCRIFLLRGGRVHRLTADHIVDPTSRGDDEVLSRLLGPARAVQIDTLELEVREGDVFLLVTDGLNPATSDPTQLVGDLRHEELADVNQSLLERARELGSHDDATVVTVRCMGSGLRPDAAEALARIPFFRRLELADVYRLAAAGGTWTFASPEVVIDHRTDNDSLWIVLEGELTITSPRRKPAVLTAGDWVGALALVRPLPEGPRFVASANTKLFRLHREAFDALVRENEHLGIIILEGLAEGLASLITDRLPDLII